MTLVWRIGVKLTYFGCPMWARERCRISPPRFMVECCKRQLNQGSFVLLYWYTLLFTFSDLYWVCLSVFSCTVLFVSIIQVIGCEDRLRNDLYCVKWGVKLYSNQPPYYWHCIWSWVYAYVGRPSDHLFVPAWAVAAKIAGDINRLLHGTQHRGGQTQVVQRCQHMQKVGHICAAIMHSCMHIHLSSFTCNCQGRN